MKGQQRLPFPEGEDVGRSGQLPLPGLEAPGRSSQPQPSKIVPKTHPGQFQMFMTPREIRGKYEALSGDRQETWDERGGEMTKRPETTAGNANIVANTALKGQWARWHGGTAQVEDYKYARYEEESMESDDQLFARKLDEAQMSPGEYREIHGGTPGEPPGWATLASRSSAPSEVRRQAEGNYSKRTGEGSSTWNERNDEAQDYVERKVYEHFDAQDYGPSLYDRIAEEGVKSPVHLSYDQMGHTYGKNQILGGHHRLAVAEDINPDQPIPVSHWKNFHEARQSGKYT